MSYTYRPRAREPEQVVTLPPNPEAEVRALEYLIRVLDVEPERLPPVARRIA